MTKLATLPTPPLAVTYDDILRAADAIRGAVIPTRFEPSRTLSALLNAEIWLKFENLQFTASYKERGALNKLLTLSAAERADGVIAVSAGNHAQGVAYHAHRLGIPATIVMPAGTPTIKVENTRSHGAHVILEGQTLEEAHAFAVSYGAERGMTFVHPYNDPAIIAGQGTVAVEMLAAGARARCADRTDWRRRPDFRNGNRCEGDQSEDQGGRRRGAALPVDAQRCEKIVAPCRGRYAGGRYRRHCTRKLDPADHRGARR